MKRLLDTPKDPASADLEQLLRLQAQARSLQLPSARRAMRQRRGSHFSTLRGRGMSLAEIRPYQAGDDVRRIDWRVTARRQAPHTRVYEEERERPVLILCDLGPSLFFASEGCFKQARAAQLAALLAWVAHSSGDQTGGIVFGGEQTRIVRPARRRRNVLQLLSALAEQQRHSPGLDVTEHRNDLDEALSEARRLAHTGTRIFVISDFRGVSSDTRMLLSSLTQHNQTTAVVLTDPLDSQLPRQGTYAVAGADHTVWFDGDDRALQRVWHDRYSARLTGLANLCRQTGTSLLELATAEDPVRLMHSLTSSGGRLL